MTGRIIAVVGPSGVGKDTLLAGAVAQSPRLHWAQRVITRPLSAGGEPFLGVTRAEFATRQAQGDFALIWEAHDLCYAIPHAEIAIAATGRDVVFNGSRAALPAARAAFPALMVLRISAPSKVLADRLATRGRETPVEIEARLCRASYDVPDGLPVIDVVNDGTRELGIARLMAALWPLGA